MTEQHTPGPWKTSATTDYWIIYDPDSKPVATTLGPKLNKHAKSEANARLIAAAPDLLAVVIHARNVLPNEHWADDTRRMLDAAIARATHKEQT